MDRKCSTTPEAAFQKIRIEDAVGLRLAHDITEIRPGQFKGPSFRKGHRVEAKDLCHLMRLGKRHLYVLELNEDRIHEDDAALEMARALAGSGIVFDPAPREGKIQFQAAFDGLLKVRVAPLIAFNRIPDVMCASLHTHTPVRKGQVLAATRAVPLVIDRNVLDRALRIATENRPVLAVRPYKALRAKLMITGNEVYDGLIEDRFEAIVTDKLAAFGAVLEETVVLPDAPHRIAREIRKRCSDGTDMIITTGGMSVDPDDVTRAGILEAGVDHCFYSAAVLPGAMFLIAYRGDVPIVGIPACALYHRATVFDLMLPRLLAGEKPNDRDLARLAHGGLCMNCAVCRYPACAFGKSL